MQLLLSAYSQTEDIIVATIVDNRKRPELADVIGPFANNVALRTSLSGQQALQSHWQSCSCEKAPADWGKQALQASNAAKVGCT